MAIQFHFPSYLTFVIFYLIVIVVTSSVVLPEDPDLASNRTERGVHDNDGYASVPCGQYDELCSATDSVGNSCAFENCICSSSGKCVSEYPEYD